MVRDLIGVIDRERAAVGVLICLAEPTGPMRAEAADAGQFVAKSVGGARVPRVQLLTIPELLAGKKIALPPQQAVRAFRQAPKAKRAAAGQAGLF